MQNKTNEKDIILYKDKTKKYIDSGKYQIIYKNEKYSVIFEEDTSFFYVVTYMREEKNRDMYYIDLKTKKCRCLGNDCYAVGLQNKEIVYNAMNNCFIGERHDRIYPSMLYDNCLILCNQDYITNGRKVHMITSYSNYDGRYIGNIYDKMTEKYYNPEEIELNSIISDVNNRFVELMNKTKKKIIKKY